MLVDAKKEVQLSSPPQINMKFTKKWLLLAYTTCGMVGYGMSTSQGHSFKNNLRQMHLKFYFPRIGLISQITV